MKHFKQVTSTPPSAGLTNAVIMGRKTWESIPSKFRPLDGRINVVLSRSGTAAPPERLCESSPVIVATSLEAAMAKIEARGDVGSTFVIGGGEVYRQAVEGGLVNRVVYTNVKGVDDGAEFDAFFPELDGGEWECVPYVAPGGDDGERAAKKAKVEEMTDAKSGLKYEFLEYVRRDGADIKPAVSMEESGEDAIPEGPEVNPEEMQYLDICRDIIENGVQRGDRTGTGTKSKFGVQMRYSLRDGALPLLTTKRTFWRGVAEELLWFVSGSTNANELAEKNIHIWDGNGSREFLDSRGLSHREEGDLGPVYGFQWRHFGAEYDDMHADYKGKGVDQLADCIDKIRNNPEDRRIVMSAWNPADLEKMALPPCHMFCQFYVSFTCCPARLSQFDRLPAQDSYFRIARSTRRRMNCRAKCTKDRKCWHSPEYLSVGLEFKDHGISRRELRLVPLTRSGTHFNLLFSHIFCSLMRNRKQTQCRHGARRPLQHSILRPPDAHGGQGHGAQAGGLRPHDRGRPRLPEPRGRAEGAAGA